MRSVDQALKLNNLEMDVVGLFEFLQAGIHGREHAKFVFTRSLSETISLLAELGARQRIQPRGYVVLQRITDHGPLYL